MSPSPASMISEHSSPVVARYSSYTSVVHQEKTMTSSSVNLGSLVQCMVEWLVVLEKLEEERKMYPVSVVCRCDKAVKINDQLRMIGRGLSQAAKLEERLERGVETDHGHLTSVHQDIVELAGVLRAEVSILISSSVGRAEPGTVDTARNIVSETECVETLVQETLETLTKLVTSLLGVDTCQHCTQSMDTADQEIDPDIMNMVAAMCGDYSDNNKTDPK